MRSTRLPAITIARFPSIRCPGRWKLLGVAIGNGTHRPRACGCLTSNESKLATPPLDPSVVAEQRVTHALEGSELKHHRERHTERTSRRGNRRTAPAPSENRIGAQPDARASRVRRSAALPLLVELDHPSCPRSFHADPRVRSVEERQTRHVAIRHAAVSSSPSRGTGPIERCVSVLRASQRLVAGSACRRRWPARSASDQESTGTWLHCQMGFSAAPAKSSLRRTARSAGAQGFSVSPRSAACGRDFRAGQNRASHPSR